MEYLKIIRDKSLLDSSCFMELQPGKYSGRCWLDKSIFIDDDAFCYLETVIESVVKRFDHYEITEISKSDWLIIIAQYKELLGLLDSAKSVSDIKDYLFIYHDGHRNAVNKRFDQNKAILKNTLTELIEWLEHTLEHYSRITIIGM